MGAKRYDPSVETDPLFDITPGMIGSPRPKRESVRSVAFGSCPGHTDDGSARRTGLVRQGGHLVWRWHQTKTFAGLAIDCPSSGQPVCTSPSRSADVVPCSCHKRIPNASETTTD
jgi:hypothetical protein